MYTEKIRLYTEVLNIKQTETLYSTYIYICITNFIHTNNLERQTRLKPRILIYLLKHANHTQQRLLILSIDYNIVQNLFTWLYKTSVINFTT